MQKPRIIKVINHKSAVNWLSFGQMYVPFLNKDEISTFMNLFAQGKMEKVNKWQDYKYSQFIVNCGLTEDQMESILYSLQKINLIKIEDQEETRIIHLEKIKSICEIVKDEEFNKNLEKTLTSEKYKDLITSFAGFKPENELVAFAYADFYGGVRDLLGHDFFLCEKSMNLIKTNQENLSISDFQECAYWSIVKIDNKYQVSPLHFSFLIKQKMSENLEEFNMDDHNDFWRNLNNFSIEEINVQFKNLFHKNNPFTLYKLLTSKEKTPDALGKWIKTRIQDYSFDFPVINALMSFVICLLGKIPINYLIKMSETIINNYAPNNVGLLKLTKSVIESDIKNGKNRLNVAPKNNLKTDKSKQSEGFIRYFSPE